MPEIVGEEGAVLYHGESETAEVARAGKVFAEDGDSVRKGGVPVGEAEAGAGRKGGVQTDVFGGAVIVGLESGAVEVDGGGGVAFEEGRESAAVVVVTVGEDGEVDGGEVDAQRGGVFGEEGGLPHVEEDAGTAGFDVQAESVFGAEGVAHGGIFNETGQSHLPHPFRRCLLHPPQPQESSMPSQRRYSPPSMCNAAPLTRTSASFFRAWL